MLCSRFTSHAVLVCVAGKHGGTFGDQRLVKLGSKEPGVVPRLIERLEKVINDKKREYLKRTGRASSGGARKFSAHKV